MTLVAFDSSPEASLVEVLDDFLTFLSSQPAKSLDSFEVLLGPNASAILVDNGGSRSPWLFGLTLHLMTGLEITG